MASDQSIIEYYDALADHYDNDRFGNSYGRFVDRQERILIERILKGCNDKLILDIACGTGRLTNYAHIGLDASANMISVARRKHPDKEFVVADADDTGFPDNFFDTIFGFHLLMHLDIEKVTNIFIEASRILKPRGKFIFDLPSFQRRNLSKRTNENWHGNFTCSVETLKQMNANLKLEQYYGLMLLPIHRLPVGVRKHLVHLDLWAANNLFKPFSSYHVYTFTKK